jgi:hypothetical protein
MDAAGELREVADPGMMAQFLEEAQGRVADLEQELKSLREAEQRWLWPSSVQDQNTVQMPPGVARALILKHPALYCGVPDSVDRVGLGRLAAPRVRDRRAEVVANPELYAGVPDDLTPTAVVGASLASRWGPARLSQSFLDTILHTALGTATSIAVARALSASVVPGGVTPHPEPPKEEDTRSTGVLSPSHVEGDQAQVDLGTLLAEIDEILKHPDTMGIVDADTLRIVRE